MNWDEGQIKIIETGAMAGNFGYTFACRPGKKMKLLSIIAYLDTDASAGNRYIQALITNDATTTVHELLGYSAVIIADKIGILLVNGTGVLQNATLNYSTWAVDVASAVGNTEIVMNDDETLCVNVYNGVAADSLTLAIKYIEMPE